MTSSEWFSMVSPSGILFDQLWPKSVTNYWNQWAQLLNSRSEAYNFSYSERFSAPLLNLDPTKVDTLTMILLAQPTMAG
jgi:hypothetical protein